MKGLELKAYRENKGWSQEKLAKEAGVTKRTVINWEQSEELSDSKVKLLQSVFGLDQENIDKPLYKESEEDASLEKQGVIVEKEEIISHLIKKEAAFFSDRIFSLWFNDHINQAIKRICDENGIEVVYNKK